MNKALAFLQHAKSGLSNIRNSIVQAIISRSKEEGGNREEISLTLEDIGISNLKEKYYKTKAMHNRGREDYFELVISSFLKKVKHNIILVGNPGVGKEAIIEGVAERIAKRKVPEELKGKEVWKLDIDKFITGEYTESGIPTRLKVLHNILKNKGNVILYLYPLYVLPEYRIVNDLANAIAGTGTLVIGTLTQAEYTENSELFEDCFATETVDVINILEPQMDELFNILKFKIRDYSRYHKVKISKQAFDKCVSEVYRLSVGELDLDMLLDYVDSAANIAKLNGKEELDYQSILEVQKFQVREVSMLSEEEKMKLAMHEAAHAVVGFCVGQPPKTISIIPGSDYLGINLFEEKFKSRTRSDYVNLVAVYMASLASNQILEGEDNNEGGGDLKTATLKAKNMVLNFAMRKEGGSLGKYLSYVEGNSFQEEHFTAAQRHELTGLVDEILKEAVQKAKTLLKDKSEEQVIIAKALCQNASLTEQEARDLFDGTITLDDLPNANLQNIK